MINIELATKTEALTIYLPFVKQGALLIETQQRLKLADELKINILLPELKQEIECEAKVVWIAAKDLQGKIKYGAQLLGEEELRANQLIENYLAGMLNYDA